MKVLLLASLFSIAYATAFSQYADTAATMLAKDYLRKSNKQKTAGWILLGGGAGLAGIGIIVSATTALGDLIEGDDGSTGGPILMFTGLVSMAGSIPLFLAAGKNRRKAMASISLKMEKTTLNNSWVSSPRRYPVVAIRVHL
jgi:hypothetical protein